MTCATCTSTAGRTITPAIHLPGVLRLDEAARTFLGVPFQHQGRTRHGLDCVGLVVLSAVMCGIATGDFTDYTRDPHHGLLESHLERVFGAPVADIRPGDVVAIDYKGATRHVGIVAEYPGGGLSLIHASHFTRCVTEHRIDDRWMKRIVGVYRP